MKPFIWLFVSCIGILFVLIAESLYIGMLVDQFETFPTCFPPFTLLYGEHFDELARPTHHVSVMDEGLRILDSIHAVESTHQSSNLRSSTDVTLDISEY